MAAPTSVETPVEPTERIVEQAYFHVSDGGMTLSVLEHTAGGRKTYSFKHTFSAFGAETAGSFPLGNSDIVSWMTMALNRISMRVVGAESERSWQPFKTKGDVIVQNGIPTKQAALVLRVAARYQRSFQQTAIEFDTPEAMQEYLKAHPGADKTLHHVKKQGPDTSKHEEPSKDQGHGKDEHGESSGHGEGEEKKPKQTFKERLQSLSAKAKSFISNAPAEVKSFISDDAHRRGVLTKMHTKLVNLPENIYNDAKKVVKHEIHEFKEAGAGIKAVLKGDKMTPSQKHAVKMVSFDVALTVATAAITGGLGAGVKGLIAKSVESFVTALAKKVALNTVTDGLGNLTTVEELGHFGHGLHHVLEHVLTAAADDKGKDKKKGDDRDLIVAYITKIVGDQLKDLSPDVLADAIEEASKGEPEAA